jgi:hypothetical protein
MSSINWETLTFAETVRATILADRDRLLGQFSECEQTDPHISCLDELKRRGMSEIDALKVVAAALAESRKILSDALGKAYLPHNSNYS